MPAWLFSGLASLAGAALTRREAKKEAARVAARNRAEAARIQKVNQAAAAKAQKQNTQVRQNYYKNVVSDAQSAGINPLTALRTGGGAGYATAVAGTMSNAVMLEGVYEAPTLSRNPLAAGLEAATNTYLSEITRQKNYSHDVRMAELRGSIDRANMLAVKGVTGSPDGKLPPRDQWWRYVREADGSLKTDAQGYAIERVALTSEPLTRDWRLANFSYRGHNPEAFESSLAEMAGSGKAHAAAGLPQGAMQYLRELRYSIGSPISRAPFENDEWSNEWRSHVNGALK
jgi:hypothetical protein